MDKIPNWAKAAIVFGGIGLAGYFIYSIYKAKRQAENNQAAQPKTISIPVQQFGKVAARRAAQVVAPESRPPAG